ncbi:hypothetical protein [Paenibacillus glacialis]|nr:hypothetical protein [Paenibacillus glacialis]
MQEFVGHCKECSKEIYCYDGFISGIVLENQTVICFDCSEEDEIQIK